MKCCYFRKYNYVTTSWFGEILTSQESSCSWNENKVYLMKCQDEQLGKKIVVIFVGKVSSFITVLTSISISSDTTRKKLLRCSTKYDLKRRSEREENLIIWSFSSLRPEQSPCVLVRRRRSELLSSISTWWSDVTSPSPGWTPPTRSGLTGHLTREHWRS